MDAFIWTVAGITTIETLAKIAFLAKGVLPPRRTNMEAVDVVLGIALLVWAAALLSRY
jgi:hypothetical protein